jgi:hypothetical protein
VDEPAEYVVKVKAWPAYLIIGLLIVMIPLYGVLAWLLVPDDGGWLWIGTIGVLLCGILQVVALGWAVWRVLRLVAHPLRISAAGLRLWLLPTASYVDLPWERVIAVHVAVKGRGRGIFVYVWEPEAFAAGDPAAARRIRREMRRLFGTPIVFPVSSRRTRLAEVDSALRHYSGGRIGLVHGARVGHG